MEDQSFALKVPFTPPTDGLLPRGHALKLGEGKDRETERETVREREREFSVRGLHMHMFTHTYTCPLSFLTS